MRRKWILAIQYFIFNVVRILITLLVIWFFLINATAYEMEKFAASFKIIPSYQNTRDTYGYYERPNSQSPS